MEKKSNVNYVNYRGEPYLNNRANMTNPNLDNCYKVYRHVRVFALIFLLFAFVYVLFDAHSLFGVGKGVPLIQPFYIRSEGNGTGDYALMKQSQPGYQGLYLDSPYIREVILEDHFVSDLASKKNLIMVFYAGKSLSDSLTPSIL
jgi:hypothetical protein